MSVFGSIMSKIFGHGQAAAQTAGTQAAAPASPDAQGPATAPQQGTTAQSTAASPARPGDAQPAAGWQPVDVEAILTDMASKNPQKLDWRHSIVDLMKLLGLDSSLEARKELARELNYSGSTSDSAAMNIWLHKQVMQKLAENGGKVPEDLRR
ncbi:MAG: DUF3597 domain-containing protein [Acetobacteraceae bacterium]|nr:DUF3597 domain-containing protein [Acetobacteraceae bacterium]